MSFPAWDAQAPLRIGAAMVGGIDEVAVYQRPLTAAGVADLFAQPQAAQAAAPPSMQVRTAPATRANVSSATPDGGFYKKIDLDDCQALDDNYDGDTADTHVTWNSFQPAGAGQRGCKGNWVEVR
ncbi:hypothetical protein [Planomonospora alba]|uniref:hypothetical protein n=1 Tax=Planomonospora alba TaxID=161354 RepID=UPI0031EC58E9